MSGDQTLEWRKMVDDLRQQLYDAEAKITRLQAMYVIASRRGNQFSDEIVGLKADLEIARGNPKCLPRP